MSSVTEPTAVDFAVSIAEAEQEGAGWPSEPAPELVPHLFNAPHSGSDERICVKIEVGSSETGNWRSGDFVAGNFDFFLELWATNRSYNQLYWPPLHSESPGLHVRGVLLDDPEITVQFRTERFLLAPLSADSEGSRRYYASAFEIPRPGRWMLVATSGPDWGCFILELPG